MIGLLRFDYICNRSFQFSVELQDTHGTNPNVEMLRSKDEVDFFDHGDEVRKNAPPGAKLKQLWRYSIRDFTL